MSEKKDKIVKDKAVSKKNKNSDDKKNLAADNEKEEIIKKNEKSKKVNENKKKDDSFENNKENKLNQKEKKINNKKQVDKKESTTLKNQKENIAKSKKEDSKNKQTENAKKVKENNKSKKTNDGKKVKENSKSKEKNKELKITKQSKKNENELQTQENINIVETVGKTLKENKKIPKDQQNKINSIIFKDICIANIIMFYFIFIILGFLNIENNIFIIDLKVFSLSLLLLGIGIIECAYKKDNGKYAICGIEILILAIVTIFSIYINFEWKGEFVYIITTISYAFAIYYVIKAIIKYLKMRKEYFIDKMKKIIKK